MFSDRVSPEPIAEPQTPRTGERSRRLFPTILLTVLGLLVLQASAFFVFIYSGRYDVAASKPEQRLVSSTMRKIMTNSVRRHAKGIAVPALGDAAQLKAGAGGYKKMCQGCHGGLAMPPGEVGLALNPPAPDLTKTAQRWTPSELFWIAKHGIKATGMPAWGSTQTDAELWPIIAFVQKMPGLTSEQYQSMVRVAAQEHVGKSKAVKPVARKKASTRKI